MKIVLLHLIHLTLSQKHTVSVALTNCLRLSGPTLPYFTTLSLIAKNISTYFFPPTSNDRSSHLPKIDEALQKIVGDLKNFGDSLENLVSLVNLYQKPLDKKVVSYYRMMKKTHKGQNIFKIISQELENRNIHFSELINQKHEEYEKV